MTAYGADPDDDTSDDTQAFIDVINAVNSQSGMMFIPAGDYRITSELPSFNTQISLVGAGIRSTIINYEGGNQCFEFTENQSYVGHFEIDGTNADAGTNGIVAGEGRGLRRSTIESIGVYNFPEIGGRFDEIWTTTFFRCDFFSNGSRGVVLGDDGTGSEFQKLFIACRFNQNSAQGFRWTAGSNLTFIGSAFETTTASALTLVLMRRVPIFWTGFSEKITA